MKRTHLAGLLLLPALSFLPGCVPPNESPRGLPTVASNSFGPHTAARMKNLPAADADLAMRVDCAGRQLLAANKNSGLDPQTVFITYPAQTLEIFHIDRNQVYITEGLVKKCNGEELAAALACELGKMAAVHMAANLDPRDVQRSPPIVVPIGSDIMPQTSQADLARIEKERTAQKAAARPDPRQLARLFLDNAGLRKDSLETVRPLLDQASLNCAIADQVKGLPSNWRSWEP